MAETVLDDDINVRLANVAFMTKATEREAVNLFESFDNMLIGAAVMGMPINLRAWAASQLGSVIVDEVQSHEHSGTPTTQQHTTHPDLHNAGPMPGMRYQRGLASGQGITGQPKYGPNMHKHAEQEDSAHFKRGVQSDSNRPVTSSNYNNPDAQAATPGSALSSALHGAGVAAAGLTPGAIPPSKNRHSFWNGAAHAKQPGSSSWEQSAKTALQENPYASAVNWKMSSPELAAANALSLDAMWGGSAGASVMKPYHPTLLSDLDGIWHRQVPLGQKLSLTLDRAIYGDHPELWGSQAALYASTVSGDITGFLGGISNGALGFEKSLALLPQFRMFAPLVDAIPSYHFGPTELEGEKAAMALGFFGGIATGLDAPMTLMDSALSKSIARVAASELGGGGQEVLDTEAVNHINLLRLNKQLTIDQAKSLLIDSGRLTPEAINNSRLIAPGEELGNSTLRSNLSKIGGDISDWGKYSTQSVSSPSGDFQMHFYHNSVTGDVYYGMDFKAVFDHQGAWDLEPGPNFDYEPPKLRH